ncbi:hypothetical protein ACIPWF_14050 [Paenarthrobacter sp. NPDC089989]|uniref:hypothetical protein n=1 Tax=unclassified Paenarthrobacter TaxID=2634190 RepID=UPI003802D950
MLGNPTGVLVFKRLDLVACGPVQLIARDILVNLRRTLTIRTVGASNVLGVRHTGRTVFAGFAETATTGPVLAEGPAIPTTVVPVAIGPITEGLTVIVTARAIAFAPGTIAERAAVIAVAARTIKVPRTTFRAVTKRLAVTVVRPALTIAGRTLPAACRAVTKGTALTIAGRTLPAACRAVTKATAVVTVTARTITKRLPVTTKRTTLIPITARTVGAALGTLSERLAIAVKRSALTVTGRTLKGLPLAIGTALVIAISVFPGAEAPGVAAGVVIGTVGTAVSTIPAEVTAIAASITAVVLSHYGFLLLRADQWRVRSRS